MTADLSWDKAGREYEGLYKGMTCA
jgi:hypothetical protein